MLIELLLAVATTTAAAETVSGVRVPGPPSPETSYASAPGLCWLQNDGKPTASKPEFVANDFRVAGGLYFVKEARSKDPFGNIVDEEKAGRAAALGAGMTLRDTVTVWTRSGETDDGFLYRIAIPVKGGYDKTAFTAEGFKLQTLAPFHVIHVSYSGSSDEDVDKAMKAVDEFSEDNRNRLAANGKWTFFEAATAAEIAGTGHIDMCLEFGER